MKASNTDIGKDNTDIVMASKKYFTLEFQTFAEDRMRIQVHWGYDAAFR